MLLIRRHLSDDDVWTLDSGHLEERDSLSALTHHRHHPLVVTATLSALSGEGQHRAHREAPDVPSCLVSAVTV